MTSFIYTKPCRTGDVNELVLDFGTLDKFNPELQSKFERTLKSKPRRIDI